uniref:Synaptotagmin 11 n=1 Tax=Ornithorhynchus anatinus TaxID=9258 RepID=A0A6I8NWZ8_ORNAN
MAEITNLRPPYDVSPVVAGLVGATVLVVSVSVSVFVWTCCRRRAQKKHQAPPYKFIHMLKGVSIYPEPLGRGAGQRKGERAGRGTGPGRGAAPEPPAPDYGPGPGSPESGTPESRGSEPGSEPGPEPSPGSQTPSPPASPPAPLGTLSVAVDYNFLKKALVVTIQEARGLPATDPQTQTADPYVKMTVLPDRRHRVKTRVLRRTRNPVFDETFTFYGLPASQLQDLALHFLVLSFDRFSRDDVIGEVVLPLAGLDPATAKVQLTRDISQRSFQKCVGRGELQVSLSYQPAAQRMTVVVLKARHLPKMDITGLSGSSYLPRPTALPPRPSANRAGPARGTAGGRAPRATGARDRSPFRANPRSFRPFVRAIVFPERLLRAEQRTKRPGGGQRAETPSCVPGAGRVLPGESPGRGSVATGRAGERAGATPEGNRVSRGLLSPSAPPDPYVKVNVYYDRKRVAKKKTHVKKCTLNPVFNESFVYDVPAELLADVSIEFLVLDFDRATKNQAVGRAILGAHSVTAAGADHWHRVCSCPREPVAMWHSLSEY